MKKSNLHEEFNSPENKFSSTIDQQIPFAQEIAREKGLKVGQTVAHPSDDFAYELKEINGNTATVWFGPGREDTIKTFPLDELFDPNILKKRSIVSDLAKHQRN